MVIQDKVIDCGVQLEGAWTLRAYQNVGGEDELRYTFRGVDDEFLKRTLKEAVENGEPPSLQPTSDDRIPRGLLCSSCYTGG